MLYAWGANSHGQLGTGDCDDRRAPVQINTDNVTLASGGGGHSVLSNGAHIYTCGANTQGELGRTGDPFRFSLVPFDFDAPIVSIDCGWDFTLILTKNGTVYALGSNHYGQLGLGDSFKNTDIPHVVPLPPVRAVAAGLRHSMAVTTAGEIYAWGSNRRDQLGPILSKDEQLPSKVVFRPTQLDPSSMDKIGSRNALQCSAGAYHSAIITDDGSVTIWGDLTYLDPANDHPNRWQSHQSNFLRIPSTLFGGNSVVQLASGWSHLAARTAIGTVFTWGRSHLGQLARPNSGSQPMQHDATPSPVRFPTADGEPGCEITHLASGSEHVLVTDVSGRLYVWGWNEHGMCGISEPDEATVNRGPLSTVGQPSLIHVDSNKSFRALSVGAGYGHSFALGRTDDGFD